MSQCQNQTNNYNFCSSSNNNNQTNNPNIENLRERLNQMQINNTTEIENNSQNINNNTNPVQENQTQGNNNTKLSSKNISLNNIDKEMYEESYYFPLHTNSEHNNGGLVFNEEFLYFPDEAHQSTENNEDKIENFDSSNYSSNTH